MIWKDVVGYEGIYEVSDTGLIRTKKGKTTQSIRHGERVWKQRSLKQKIGKDQSCRVTLYKNKVPRTWLVHRVVAKAFLPMVPDKEYINHIDGSRLNNDISNLEWCNHTENNNHAFDNDLIKTGEKVILMNKETNETFYFRSKAKASEFLGKNDGYLSGRLKLGKNEIQGYIIFIAA